METNVQTKRTIFQTFWTNIFMHQGEKFRKYLKSTTYTQKRILEITAMSKSKLYGIYKQSELSKDDRDQLIKEFELPDNFFDVNEGGVSTTERNYSNDISWERKYYEILEKYNTCLEDKDKLRDELKSKIELLDKHFSK